MPLSCAPALVNFSDCLLMTTCGATAQGVSVAAAANEKWHIATTETKSICIAVFMPNWMPTPGEASNWSEKIVENRTGGTQFVLADGKTRAQSS